jgi:hypothetical protein
MNAVFIVVAYVICLQAQLVVSQQNSVAFKVGVGLENVMYCTTAGNNFLRDYFNSYIPLYGGSYFRANNFSLDRNLTQDPKVPFDHLAFSNYSLYLTTKIANASRTVVSLRQPTMQPTAPPQPTRRPTTAAPTKKPTLSTSKRLLSTTEQKANVRDMSLDVMEPNLIRRLPSTIFIWSGLTSYTCRMCRADAYDARRLNEQHGRKTQSLPLSSLRLKRS